MTELHKYIVLLSTFFLFSCSGSNSSGNSQTPVSLTDIVPAQTLYLADQQYGAEPVTRLQFVNSGGAASKCEVVPALPNGLAVALQAGSCEIRGNALAAREKTKYTVIATNSRGWDTASVELRIRSSKADFSDGMDPLRREQWSYKNTGQYSYSGLPAIADELNLEPIHAAGIIGAGVEIMVVDDGVELAHPDLQMSSRNSYNFLDKTNNPTPIANEDNHGTAVAGIINMQNNAIGGLGVAPGATVYAVNFLGTGVTDDDGVKLLFSLGLVESVNLGVLKTTQKADIFNNSWGSPACSPRTLNRTLDGYFSKAQEGRDGRGYNYVKSAGNGFSSYIGLNKFDKTGTLVNCDCTAANDAGVSCQNANGDILSSSVQFVLVGAHNAAGEVSSYSSHSANLWVSAPAGELGYSTDRAKISKSDLFVELFAESSYRPAIITTDRQGCNKGISAKGASSTDFDYDNDQGSRSEGYVVLLTRLTQLTKWLAEERYTLVAPHPDNPDCDYTSTMNGTSAAAPYVSGVIALLLQVNPDFTWRDIKHILASATRDQADDYIPLDKKTVSVGSDSVTIADGWTQNAAGYRFSNAYGFGRITAQRAVRYARDYTPDFGNYKQMYGKKEGKETIPSKDSSGVSSTIQLEEGIDFIENVRVLLTIDHHELNNVLVTLKSPQNTTSILFWPHNGFAGKADFTDFSLISNAFYGEKAQGDWTVRIIDVASEDESADVLQKWTIEIHGHTKK